MNPFDPKNPADDKTFSGRTRELDKLHASFERTLNGRPSHVLICGERGVGKTSLVRHLWRHYRDKGTFFVFCRPGECRGLDELMEQCVSSFYNELKYAKEAGGILECVGRFLASLNGVTVGPLGITWDANAVKQVTSNLSGVLFRLWNEIRERYGRFVLVFDEADRIAQDKEYATAFSFAVRAAIEELGRRDVAQIKFIISAIPELRQKIEEVHDSLLRSLDVIELGRFDSEAVYEVLEKGLQSSNPTKRCEPSFRGLLCALSDGIPYHVQALCYHAFEHDEDGALDKNDLVEGLFADGGALDRLDEYPFAPLWKRVENWNGAKEILVALAAAGGSTSLDELCKLIPDCRRTTLSTVASQLRSVGFISSVTRPGSYSLSSTLCRIWIDQRLRAIEVEDIQLPEAAEGRPKDEV